jgi:hypothetical protein
MIGELVPLSLWAEPVARLRCLRGIDTLSAVGFAPAARRGGLALPPSAPQGRHAPTPPTRPARPDDRDLLESPAAPPPHLAPPRHPARETQDPRRGRRRPPPRRLLLGDHQQRPQRLTPHQPHNPRLRRRQNPPGTLHAREHPRFNYEQPPPRPRSILDSGLSRRNPVLRYPTRAYQSDQTSRTRQACRPQPSPHTTNAQAAALG